MDVITVRDIGGDEDLARRVLQYARSIAPIDTISNDAEDDTATAVAILRAAAREGGLRSRQVSSERAGGVSVSYYAPSSWFSDEDRDALRALCKVASSDAHTPIGSFPPPSRVLSNLWPEPPNV